MLTTVAALVNALLLPSGDQNLATRRSALQAAASLAFVPLLPAPATADVYDDRVGSGFGGTGALRSDIGPSLKGDGVEMLVTDLSYTELAACPSGFFIPTKGGPWTCIEITATAFNQGRQKKASAAEIFGQMYDAEGFACLATALDPTQKSPVTSIEGPFLKGQSQQIKFVAAVQSRSPRPLRFAGFKGAYRNAGIERTFKTFDPCEIDSSQCDDPLDQPDNAKALLQGGGFTYDLKK
mmetsp:Transcript_67488/g.133834  ORF Transcript_67488/g.133834 Transcript_67488/m.133834 type:complete len:238 (-) Transcript_67488:228-941(-)|eukprot:CAMPEP_0174719716 /NCGR_PEP_ID=MMETSP1094-20130205/31814_1 /TAXON_ID=156173 /ORGANISM="Chrysochromulina brevifilum, Strain UTEX LB 985" /LENGTH=237 /DNA_ID=CAMNT_0015920069 /DNA_START=84 /DNA_END=797 /DNA_ORIENTATION=+